MAFCKDDPTVTERFPTQVLVMRKKVTLSCWKTSNSHCNITSGLIPCLRPANERWRYFVTPSLIGWAYASNQPYNLPPSTSYKESAIISSIGRSSSSSSTTTVRPFTWYMACKLAESQHICKNIYENIHLTHGPLTRYVKLPVAHLPGMPETFFPPPRVSDPEMHYGAWVTHARSPFKSVEGKTFPGFPAHGQTAILRIW